MGRAPPAATLLAAAAAVTACGPGQPAASQPQPTAAVRVMPERILQAPGGRRAVAQPLPNGVIWLLAGRSSAGLFQLDSASARPGRSISVSSAARSVAVSAAGTVGLALGTGQSGALELLNGRTGKAVRTVLLPAPGRQVIAGGQGTTFYVLSAWRKTAGVTMVNSRTGQVRGTIPVPSDTVSMVPDATQASVYALEATGLVDQIGIPGGQIMAKFKPGTQGKAIAISPDGDTLYVLKGSADVANVAVVDVSTESVRRVLPAPSHCRGLAVSASGRQLYEVVGTSRYGNIQAFGI